MTRRKLIRTVSPAVAADQNSQTCSPPPSPPPSPPAVSGEKRPSQDGGEEMGMVRETAASSVGQYCCGRERLQRHRSQVARRIWIPEVWGKEEFLKDWTDCALLDQALVPRGFVSAKAALIEECGRNAGSGGIRIDLAAV